MSYIGLTCEDFFEICKDMKFSNFAEYHAFASTYKGVLGGIPKHPHRKYGQEFHDRGCWEALLKDDTKKYSFEEFLVACKKYHFTGLHDYQRRYSLDPKLPSNPDVIYKNSGWKKMGGWFCISKKKTLKDGRQRIKFAANQHTAVTPPSFQEFLIERILRRRASENSFD